MVFECLKNAFVYILKLNCCPVNQEVGMNYSRCFDLFG